ncbi:MAG: penicillin-binding transpeptidase domain-containing protein [Paraperlucidibaca sp.]
MNKRNDTSAPSQRPSNTKPIASDRDGLKYVGRHRIVLLGLSILFGGIALRAGYLTMVDSDFLRAQGDARMMRTEPIMAMRGVIRDRNNTPLAVSTPVTTLWLNPRQAIAAKLDVTALAHTLQLSPTTLQAKIKRNRDKSFMYLVRHLAPNDAEVVLAKDYAGVYSMTEYKRFYPEAEATAHMLGFTGMDDHGREGLELAFDKKLAGIEGSKRVMKDLKGHRVQDVALLKPARPGQDVMLSFDSRVQYSAYRELARGVAEHDAVAGVLVSLDVETGEVLAMASVPSYNPNNRSNLNIDAVRNRAVTDMFEPGSTLKPFTLVAALESGKFTTSSRFDTSPGTYKVLNKLVRDHEDFGVIDMPTVLTKSSNVATSQIAMALPRDTLPLLHQHLGFGRTTGSGFPGESAGLLQPSNRWNPVEVATMSYGYGITVTALQLAQAYATIASGGIQRPVSFIKVVGPVEGRRVIPESIAKSLIPMMETVVTQEGTALRAAVPGYRVAGKTGTAHKAQSGGYSRDQYMSLFVGLAPASHPKIVTAVIIDTPRKGGYFGGLAAAPVFSRSMADTLRLMNVEPDRSAERLADQARPPYRPAAGG